MSTIQIHPQAGLQISNHYTRSKYVNPPFIVDVGFLMGTIDGERIDVNGATPVIMTNEMKLDKMYSKRSVSLYLKNFPIDSPVGFYVLGSQSKETIESIVRAFSEYYDPVIYAVFDFTGDNPPEFFDIGSKRLDFNWTSSQAERIGLFEVQNNEKGSMKEALRWSYMRLRSELEKIRDYLVDVKDGRREFDPETIRKIAEMSRWFDFADKKEDADLLDESNCLYFCGLVGEYATDYCDKTADKVK